MFHFWPCKEIGNDATCWGPESIGIHRYGRRLPWPKHVRCLLQTKVTVSQRRGPKMCFFYCKRHVSPFFGLHPHGLTLDAYLLQLSTWILCHKKRMFTRSTTILFIQKVWRAPKISKIGRWYQWNIHKYPLNPTDHPLTLWLWPCVFALKTLDLGRLLETWRWSVTWNAT